MSEADGSEGTGLPISRRIAIARDLLDDFAGHTGLDGTGPPRRYLWTDAFAVGVDLALHHQTGDPAYLERAHRLVDQVHRVLGRHREDDPRDGWISGSSESAGTEHPTAGGLRIGKPLPERGTHERRDPDLEWERDGQYYHYLTRWMHALARMAQVTGQARHLRWAVELGSAAHRGFVHRAIPGGPLRIYWKMSIDLSRPLVESQGAHDPLDGFTSLVTLRAAAANHTPEVDGGVLDEPIAELRELCRDRSWVSGDPLGIGGLLLDLHRLAALAVSGVLEDAPSWLESLAEDAIASLGPWSARRPLDAPAIRRVPFRELGLALGLEAVGDLAAARAGRTRLTGEPPSFAALLGELARYVSLGRQIERFWADPAHQRVSTWADHRDINAVMLAASLVPEGWLGPPPQT